MADIKVDFTDGRIFSKNNLTGVDRLIWNSLKLEFPWTWNTFQKVNSDDDLDEDPTKTLFFTGTNEQIKCKMEYAQMDRGEMCECCGDKIIRFPWDGFKKYPHLCDRCVSEMEKEYGKDLFGMPKKKEIPEDIWWLIV